MNDNQKVRFLIKLMVESHGAFLQSWIVGEINELKEARPRRISLKNDLR